MHVRTARLQLFRLLPCSGAQRGSGCSGLLLRLCTGINTCSGRSEPLRADKPASRSPTVGNSACWARITVFEFIYLVLSVDGVPPAHSCCLQRTQALCGGRNPSNTQWVRAIATAPSGDGHLNLSLALRPAKTLLRLGVKTDRWERVSSGQKQIIKRGESFNFLNFNRGISCSVGGNPDFNPFFLSKLKKFSLKNTKTVFYPCVFTTYKGAKAQG